MGLGLNPADTPDLFKDKSGKELPVESLNGTDKTAYLKIDLKVKPMGGAAIEPMTAVFAPDPKQLPGGAVDVLLWLHGDKHYWNKDHSKEFDFPSGATIQYYLTSPDVPLCNLRKVILQSSKRKFVLVAPTLNDSTGVPMGFKKGMPPGALIWGQADAEAYLQQALNGVQKHLGVGKKLALGNIVLAAHSGGGHLQAQMAQEFAGAFNRVNEVWCFDSSYWGSTPLLAWLKKGHSNARLFMYSTGGTTGSFASAILNSAPTILGAHTAALGEAGTSNEAGGEISGGDNGAKQALNEAEDQVMRALELAIKTTKIDVLIENDPNTGRPAWTEFTNALFGGMAGGHYECIEKYLTTLVGTSRNLN